MYSFFFFSSRRRHTRLVRDWSSDVCSSDLLYGTDSLGPYVGGLSGEGETIDLVDASGVRIDRVNFGVDFPWPTGADGTGSSMELINATLDNNLGSSWRSSSTAGVLGPPTAGSVNSTASAVAPPNIRQVMHTPEQPTDSEPTVITAKVSDPEGVRSVQLEFRLVAPGAYVPAYLAKSHSALLADRKSTRLNSSHALISYAVFCLKKKIQILFA